MKSQIKCLETERNQLSVQLKDFNKAMEQKLPPKKVKIQLPNQVLELQFAQGICQAPPPVFKWATGWPFNDLKRYCEQKGLPLQVLA